MKRSSEAAPKRPVQGEFARLITAFGSPKGLDPIPPDQYLSFMQPQYPEAMRLWAWVLSKTIRIGHRSHVCVSERGRQLSLADAAHDLHMDAANVRRAWRWIEAQGRVKRERGQLILAGEITKGEEKEARSVQTSPPFLRLIPSALLEAMAALSPERRGDFTGKLEQLQERRLQLQREAIAYARYVSDLEVDATCESFGLTRHTGPPRQAPAVSLHQLLGEHKANEHVQTSGSTRPDSAPGATSATLLCSRELKEPIPLPPSRKRERECKKTPEPKECKRCKDGLRRVTVPGDQAAVGFLDTVRAEFCTCAAGAELRASDPEAADVMTRAWNR